MKSPKRTQQKQHPDFTMFRISIRQMFPHKKPLGISTTTRAEVLSDNAGSTRV